MKQSLRRALTYTFICHDKTGKLKWIQHRKNIVVDEGMNYEIDQFYLGLPWYLGLIKTGTSGQMVFDTSDTAAKITSVFPPNPPTTNGWSEESAYGGRQLLVFTNMTAPGDPGVALSAALIFTYTDISKFGGGFVVSSSAGATGVLYSEMAGTAPEPVAAGDTVTATVEFDLLRPPE